jgi:hypothetical protein
MMARICAAARSLTARLRWRSCCAGILLNEHIAEDGLNVFAHPCQLGAEGIVSKRIDTVVRRVQRRRKHSMSIMSTGLGDAERRVAGPKLITITVSTARALSGLGATKIWAFIREGKSIEGLAKEAGICPRPP